jgi:putative ABC transport system ATP-binding protein
MTHSLPTSEASLQAGPRAIVRSVESTTPVSVSIRDVNHFFGVGELRKQTLFDNDLDLARGEIVVMTGPSGSGKTTLLTLIGALRSVQEGHLTVLGEPLHTLSPTELVLFRRKVGFIFQAHNLFNSLSAEQNVRMSLDLAAISTTEAGKRVRELLSELGMGERTGYKPSRLSGGQRQRVAIARALANRPGLILADEPTAALDANSGRIVMEMLKRYSSEYGTTVIVVTHDQRVLDAADRIVKMVDGRIVSDVRLKAAAMVCGYLRSCSIFADLPAATAARVAEKVYVERFTPGTIVVRQGDEANTFYVIKSGRLEVEIDDGHGSRSVRFMGEGDFFGEIALVKGGVRTATVTAREPTELLSLRKEAFHEVLDASVSFEEEMRRMIFERQ